MTTYARSIANLKALLESTACSGKLGGSFCFGWNSKTARRLLGICMPAEDGWGTAPNLSIAAASARVDI